jgi:branched-chain amino acid transport system substrate-binding protein
MAVAYANESRGASVGLEVRSEEGQWGTAGNDAVALVSERHVDAIISPSDGATNHLILQVSGRTQIPVASLCSDSSVTDAGVIWAVRVVPRTDQEAAALFVSAQRPDRAPMDWWAIVPDGRPGRAVRHDLEKAAHATAAHLERTLDLSRSKTELAAQVHLIVDAAPGGVLIWLPPSQAGMLAAALRAEGYGGCLAGPSPLDSPDFFAAAGAAANGVQIASFRADADFRGRAEKFEGQFRRSYGSPPDFAAAAAYDAATVLIETLRRAEKGAGDRQFPIARPISGVSGVLHFDNLGNRTDALQAMVCKQGCFVPLLSANTRS